MSTPRDEVLMAYVDGELPAEQRREVDRHLAESPESRAIVEAYRRSNELSRAAFEAPMREPPPQLLVDTIMRESGGLASARLATTETAGADRPTGTVVPFGRNGSGRARPRPSRLVALSMAASLAFVIGAGSGYLIRPGEGPAPGLAVGKVPPGSVLAKVLERQAQGAPKDKLLIVASFRDRDGRPCREIELLHPEAGHALPQTAAVACRQTTGEWMVEGAVRLALPAASASGYAPSGAKERDALDGLLTALGAQKVMSADDERTLIESGWR